jgi:hypothetical protein
MSNTPHPLADKAIDDAHLTLEELDHLHAAVTSLIQRLTAPHLFPAAPDSLPQPLIALEQATLRAIQKTGDLALHYGTDGQLLACPACGGLRTTCRSAQPHRACCQECGLPCDMYDRFPGEDGEKTSCPTQ